MEENNKKQACLALGLGLLAAGFIGGWLTRKAIAEEQALDPDHILDYVKKQFLKEGPIEGSWIEMTQSPSKKVAIETDVYYGGISRYEEDQLVQYEFIADAYTGSILDVYKI